MIFGAILWCVGLLIYWCVYDSGRFFYYEFFFWRMLMWRWRFRKDKFMSSSVYELEHLVFLGSLSRNGKNFDKLQLLMQMKVSWKCYVMGSCSVSETNEEMKILNLCEVGFDNEIFNSETFDHCFDLLDIWYVFWRFTLIYSSKVTSRQAMATVTRKWGTLWASDTSLHVHFVPYYKQNLQCKSIRL